MDTYDFESKHLYRQRRESAIDRLAPGNPFTRKVAYLDTSEALDTIAYLKRGYQPQNLWAINDVPAEVAHITMKLARLGLPRVNVVGVDFEKALMQRVPKVDVVNFDGTKPLSQEMADSLFRMAKLRPTAVWAVTFLAARESRGRFTAPLFKACACCRNGERYRCRTSFNRDVNARHYRRTASILHWFQDSTSRKVKKFFWDVYLSQSRQPIGWVALSLK
jgi:hypothetical protein